jgi:hypothetical protein
VETGVIYGALMSILVLDVIASTRVLRSDVHSRAQQAAWLLLVWLVPLVGAILAFQVASESNGGRLPARSCESGSEVWIPGIGPDDSYSDGSDGH